ncbi:MAG: haloacid dehalogenase type II [Haloarculaceae archaeon]
MARQALCFDMYGTLCDPSSVTETLGEVLGATTDLARAIDRLWRRKQLQYSYHRGQMEAYEPFWTVTGDALAYALDFYEVDAVIDERRRILEAYEHLEPFEGAVRALETLGAAGHTCVVLSNGNPEMLEPLAANAGLDTHLDDIVSADEVETFKPGPAVYENAATRLDRDIGDCRLVSSNAWDVVGASNAGMATAWVNRSREPRERLGEEADLEVETLAGLPSSLA